MPKFEIIITDGICPKRKAGSVSTSFVIESEMEMAELIEYCIEEGKIKDHDLLVVKRHESEKT